MGDSNELEGNQATDTKDNAVSSDEELDEAVHVSPTSWSTTGPRYPRRERPARKDWWRREKAAHYVCEKETILRVSNKP